MKGLSGQTVDSCLSSGVVQQFPGGRPGATEARHDPEESAAPHERPAGRGLQGRGSHPSRGRCSLCSQAWTQVSLPQRKRWCEGLFSENRKLLGMCLFPNAAFACASWSGSCGVCECVSILCCVSACFVTGSAHQRLRLGNTFATCIHCCLVCVFLGLWKWCVQVWCVGVQSTAITLLLISFYPHFIRN